MPTCMLMALVYTFILNLPVRCCLQLQYHSTHKGSYRYVNQYRSPRETVFVRYSEYQVVHNLGSSSWKTGLMVPGTRYMNIQRQRVFIFLFSNLDKESIFVFANFHSIKYFQMEQLIKFLFQGNFDNPKQYINFCLGFQMQLP